MKSLKRLFLVVVVLFLGFEILTFAPKRLFGPDGVEKPPAQDTSAQGAPESLTQILTGFKYVGTTDGRREWELDSDYGRFVKDKNIWDLKVVRVKFFGNQGGYYTVTGDTGQVNTDTKDMSIQGQVVMTSSEGYRTYTNSIKYVAKQKDLSTSDDVKIIGPPAKEGTFELSGKGFLGNVDSGLMKLFENVRAIKSIPPERMMTIHSVWCEINGKEKLAHFENDVQVDIENMRMTGNKGDFVYDSATQVLKSLIMQGNVKVTDQKRWASSKMAKVLFVEDEFILLGDPRVIQDENELRGEEIKFLKGGKEMQVVKARARVDKEPDELLNSH